MALSEVNLRKIQSDFSVEEADAVKAELARLNTTHTMDSEYNLNNAIGAILDLSAGDLNELSKLVDAARIDFRDVIYWWTLEQAKIKVVHEGRGGYLVLNGSRYPIDHVAGGSFEIHFPAGNRHRNLQAHLEALHAFAESREPKWSIDNRSRKFRLPED